MKILALDLGTKCGWAHSTWGSGSGVWDLSIGRHESQGMRWIKFQKHLAEILPYTDFVAYESVARHLGTHAAHIYGGMVATLQRALTELGVDYTGVPVGTIKKFATGKGNASKAMMIDMANQYKIVSDSVIYNKITDDNEADAICLLEYAKENYNTGGNARKKENHDE